MKDRVDGIADHLPPVAAAQPKPICEPQLLGLSPRFLRVALDEALELERREEQQNLALASQWKGVDEVLGRIAPVMMVST
jgi:hypothetical protein